MKEIIAGYIDALLWTSHRDGENTRAVLDELGPERLHEEVMDCIEFAAVADEVYRAHGYERGMGDLSELMLARFGHDFLLTRDGHGAGFWDGDWGDVGDALTDATEPFGESASDHIWQDFE